MLLRNVLRAFPTTGVWWLNRLVMVAYANRITIMEARTVVMQVVRTRLSPQPLMRLPTQDDCTVPPTCPHVPRGA